jgi:hypothetical protein
LQSDPVNVVSRCFQIGRESALGLGPPPAGNLAVPVFRHGSLEVELYQPRGRDPQQPHRRDESYVVVRGTGLFFDGSGSRPVGPGDFLFVPAGQVHRFEDFSEDFAVWVLFHGPEGGERSVESRGPDPVASVVAAAAQRRFRLVACDVAGNPVEPLGTLPEDIAGGCQAGAGLYWKKSFLPPWVGYVAMDGDVPVGLGGFTGLPVDGSVELAYYTRPELEGRGHAGVLRVAPDVLPELHQAQAGGQGRVRAARQRCHSSATQQNWDATTLHQSPSFSFFPHQ